MSRSSLTLTIVAVVLTATAAVSLGAGFEVAEQSGRLLGSAYAGKTAEASDASTVFFNPAGITRLDDFSAVITVHVLWAEGRFKDDGSTGALGTGLGNLNGGNAGGAVFIPDVFLSTPITENIFAGLGVGAPFGLTTDYEDGWKGRYHALESHLETLNFNPCVAYKIDDMFSVGAGFNIQRAEAKLTQAIDFGTIAFGQLGPATATSLGFSPQGNDGEAKISGDSWGYGWNAGALVTVNERLRFGLSYRSEVKHTLEGRGKFEVPSEATPLTGTGLFTNSDVEADVTLPAQASVSAYFEVNDEWTLLADVTWTGWSSFDELRVEYDNAAQPDAVTPEKWNDVFRYAIGAIWHVDEELTLRFGAAYDESPIDDKYRTPRIPTNDRIWATFGLGYRISESTTLDFSYLHVWISDGDVDQTSSTGQRLKGKFEGGADVLGINLSIGF